jgi:aminoglycoside phosphotransferase (APT) family kinase protein
VTGLALVGAGREADVYALDAHRVLRRYRTDVDATHEAMTMAYLAAHGYPVPAVHHSAGRDLVLERLTGRTIAQEWLAGAMEMGSAARMLADLHARLHAVPPPQGGGPTDRILHLDLHPENVLLTGRGPVVIDWRNTVLGPPEVDLAISALILAEVATGADEAMRAPAGELLAAFLAAVDGAPVAGLDRAVAKRGADLGLDPDALRPAADLVRRLSG